VCKTILLRFLVLKTKGVISRAPLKIGTGPKIPADFHSAETDQVSETGQDLIRPLIKFNTPDQIRRQVSYLRLEIKDAYSAEIRPTFIAITKMILQCSGRNSKA
jgi:hypothetical protein